jgi:hypothetical protein
MERLSREKEHADCSWQMIAEKQPEQIQVPRTLTVTIAGRIDFSFEKLVGVRLLVVINLALSHRLGKPAGACPEKRGF